MKVLIPILIGLLVVGCGGGSTEKIETKTKSPSTQKANNTQTKTDPKPKPETKKPEQPEATTKKDEAEGWVSDPSDPHNVIVEKEIRRALSTFSSKFTGELTKVDLEKVTTLYLSGNQLTEVPNGLEKFTQLKGLNLSGNRLTDVKGLENLTQLTRLSLRDNPDLTKAQIDELRKALPKCAIGSDFE